MNLLKRLLALNPWRKKNILFVCTGNTCRSPMAQELMRMKLNLFGKRRYVVSSAGTGAIDGEPASKNAQAALKGIGLDLSSHKSRKLTPELAQKADLVVGLTQNHAKRVRELAPGVKVTTISDKDVCDPFGRDEATYSQCALEIGRALDKMIEKI
jgi:protein-tyrosine-phosphatase